MHYRRDILTITNRRRIYDKTHNRFTFHVTYETPTKTIERTIEISEFA